MFIGKDFTPAKIAEVSVESPAEQVGLKKGDIIISIDKNKVESILEVSTFINTSTSNKINITVLRDEKKLSFNTEPKIIDSKDAFGNSLKKKIIGIKLTPASEKQIREKLGPINALYYSFNEIWFVCKTTIKFIGSLFQGKGDTSQLGGPIKIAKISGQVMEFGILAFVSTIAYISISLGLVNLFPIPLLDGGHLMFCLIEKIKGKPLSQSTQEGLFRIGLFLLISLMVFTTFNDLWDLGIFH